VNDASALESSRPASNHGRIRREEGCRPLLRCLALLALSATTACFPAAPEKLTCDDVLPAGQVEYGDLVSLISSDSAKGCAAGECHGGETQEQGLRLDSPSLIFEELTTRTDVIYAMVASGEMPAEGVRWDEADLRLFRSWYCDGALPR
jgi:hypothetical protein